MKTVTKSDLVAAVAARLSLSKAVVESVIGGVTDVIGAETAAGATVQIKGFGAFKVKERPARMGRNPATGATVEVPASARLEFKASKKAVA